MKRFFSKFYSGYFVYPTNIRHSVTYTAGWKIIVTRRQNRNERCMFVFVIFQSQIAKIEMISLKKKKNPTVTSFLYFCLTLNGNHLKETIVKFSEVYTLIAKRFESTEEKILNHLHHSKHVPVQNQH